MRIDHTVPQRSQMRCKYYVAAESGGRQVGILYDHHCGRFVIGGAISARQRMNELLRIFGAMHAQYVLPTRNKIRWEADINSKAFEEGLASMGKVGFTAIRTRHLGRVMR
jgi:hypothetical protein